MFSMRTLLVTRWLEVAPFIAAAAVSPITTVKIRTMMSEMPR